MGYPSEVIQKAIGVRDLVSRRHLTKDRDLNVIIMILIAAMRIHEITQEEK